MNGIHDMGGMHGMGSLQYEENEPVFHREWEGKSFALNLAMRAWRKWNIDSSRHAIELLQPDEYLRMSYYEKWIARLEDLIVSSGMATRHEIAVGKADPGAARKIPQFTAEVVAQRLRGGSPVSRPDGRPARFMKDDIVRTRNMHPAGHTRLPRYARDKEGSIARDHGVFVFPDTNAHGLGENPQHVYSVRFAARELWGENASPRDAVYIDLWDEYLEPA
ncbi:MAG TPA: nitrile hydratase subunit beta [Bryobacteraceae bacterium]|jgi:nitrile hydratase|nr:nitrile hydratase subunit beta [Bryobacteraceae bacterium]